MPDGLGDNLLALAGAKAGVDYRGQPVGVQPQSCVRRTPSKYRAPRNVVHKNSLDYVGDTHVYRVKGPDGTTYKIGESAQGVRVRDGASIRGEQQARALQKETGDSYRSQIRKNFPDKRSAKDYETRLIERYRRMFGDDTLPGNKTNR